MTVNTSFNRLTTPVEEEVNEKSIRETSSEEAIRLMFDRKDIEMRTDLSTNLILNMARGDIFVETFKSEKMDKFIKALCIRFVSKGRKGRSELVSLVRNSQDIMEEDPRATALGRLLGK